MAESTDKKEHDIDYADPEEEKKGNFEKKVSSLSDGVGGFTRSGKCNW